MAVTTGSGKFELPLLPDDFVSALIHAGVLADGCLYRKVVITCEPYSIVSIEVELEADQRLLNLVPELAREGS